MNDKQIEFLEQFMDDYQVNKFRYLVRNNIIESVTDIYDIREDYRNIEQTNRENDSIVRLMTSFNDINQKSLVQGIEKRLKEKRGLVESLDTFVEENISSLKEEYKEKLGKSKNIFVNNNIIKVKEKISKKESSLEAYKKRQELFVKVGYGVVAVLVLLKVFG